MRHTWILILLALTGCVSFRDWAATDGQQVLMDGLTAAVNDLLADPPSDPASGVWRIGLSLSGLATALFASWRAAKANNSADVKRLREETDELWDKATVNQ